MEKPKIPETDRFVWFVRIMWIVFFAWWIFALASCKPIEKYKASSRYPADCAKDFPPKILPGKTDTFVRPGIYIDCDSVIKANPPTTVTIYNTDTGVKITPGRTGRVPCPPDTSFLRVDTFTNTAALEACQRQLMEERTAAAKREGKLTEERDTSQRKTKHRGKVILGMSAGYVLIFAGILFRYRRKVRQFFKRTP